jgi:plasmid stabilization system protein ParE
MGCVVVSDCAERQVIRAYAWIAEQDPVRADHWFRALYAVLRSLEKFPERCPLAPEGRRFDLEVRQLIFGDYRLLFRIENDDVYVLHIRHGAMASLDEDELLDDRS